MSEPNPFSDRVIMNLNEQIRNCAQRLDNSANRHDITESLLRILTQRVDALTTPPAPQPTAFKARKFVAENGCYWLLDPSGFHFYSSSEGCGKAHFDLEYIGSLAHVIEVDPTTNEPLKKRCRCDECEDGGRTFPQSGYPCQSCGHYHPDPIPSIYAREGKCPRCTKEPTCSPASSPASSAGSSDALPGDQTNNPSSAVAAAGEGCEGPYRVETTDEGGFRWCIPGSTLRLTFELREDADDVCRALNFAAGRKLRVTEQELERMWVEWQGCSPTVSHHVNCVGFARHVLREVGR